MCLYAPFKLLRRVWRCDSQELESVMNMIQSCVQKGRNTSLQTLDAKIGIRKSITYDARHDTSFTSVSVIRKWSVFCKKADFLIDQAAPYMSQLSDVCKPSRFLASPPSLCGHTKPRHDLIDPSTRASRELRWTIHYNSLWVRHAHANPKICTGEAVTIVVATGLFCNSYASQRNYINETN